MAETHHNIGISWRERGDYPRALEAAEQAVRLATVARDDSLLGLALTGRAEIHLLMGDEDLARVELERAAEVYGRVNFAAGLPEVWRLQAAVARTRGDLPETLRLLRQAAELATTQGSAESLAAIERDFGAALQLAGDRAGAEAARRRALALYERLGATRAARHRDGGGEPELLLHVHVARVGEVGAVERPFHTDADPGEVGIGREKGLIRRAAVGRRLVNLKSQLVERPGGHGSLEHALDAAEGEVDEDRPGLQLVAVFVCVVHFIPVVPVVSVAGCGRHSGL